MFTKFEYKEIKAIEGDEKAMADLEAEIEKRRKK